MKKTKALPVLLAAIFYLACFFLGASSGLIHPACYAYAGTVLPLLFAFAYLPAAANRHRFGAAAILNGLALLIALVMGEADLPLIVGLVVLTAAAEIIRKVCGCDTRKGVRYSFIPFAFSFYAYSAHWWTDTEGALAAAAEEMPAGYADKMAPVIGNIPLLVVMLILTIPVAILGIFLAEKALKKQAAILQ